MLYVLTFCCFLKCYAVLCFVSDSVWRFVTVFVDSLFVCPFPCVRPCRIKRTGIDGLPHSFYEPAALKDTDPAPAALIGQPAALGAPENGSQAAAYAPAALVRVVDIILLLEKLVGRLRGEAGLARGLATILCQRLGSLGF